VALRAEQDNKIAELGHVIKRQKDIAGKISDELDEQDPLLNDLHSRVRNVLRARAASLLRWLTL